MANRRILAAAFVLVLTAPSALAHEFWLEPLEPRVAEGGALQVDVRIGQNMVGTAFSYIPEWLKSFDIIENGTRRPVDSFIGDRPAVNESAIEDGLAQIVYHSKLDFLTYKVWGKFKRFAAKEGLDGYISDYVTDQDLPGYIESVGGADHVRDLPLPIF